MLRIGLLHCHPSAVSPFRRSLLPLVGTFLTTRSIQCQYVFATFGSVPLCISHIAHARGQRAEGQCPCLMSRDQVAAHTCCTAACDHHVHTGAAHSSRTAQSTDWLFPEPLPAIVHKIHITVPREPSASALWTHRPSTRTSRLIFTQSEDACIHFLCGCQRLLDTETHLASPVPLIRSYASEACRAARARRLRPRLESESTAAPSTRPPSRTRGRTTRHQAARSEEASGSRSDTARHTGRQLPFHTTSASHLLALEEQALIAFLVTDQAHILGLDSNGIPRTVLQLLVGPGEEESEECSSRDAVCQLDQANQSLLDNVDAGQGSDSYRLGRALADIRAETKFWSQLRGE